MPRSPAPPLIALVMMTVVGPRSAWAEDPDDTVYDSPWGVAWQRDDSGGIVAQVAVEPFPDITVEYWLTVRLRCGSSDTSWVQGPYDTTDGLAFDIDLVFPDFAPMSNPDVLADLSVHVRATVDDQAISTLSVEPARIGWVDGVDTDPWLLDQNEATAMAPLGIIGVADLDIVAGEQPDGKAPDDLVVP